MIRLLNIYYSSDYIAQVTPDSKGGGFKQLFTTPHPVTGVITEIIECYKEDVFFVLDNVLQLIKSTEQFNDLV